MEDRNLCSFVMPDELQSRLDEVCREFHEAKSIIIRRALRQYLAREAHRKEATNNGN